VWINLTAHFERVIRRIEILLVMSRRPIPRAAWVSVTALYLTAYSLAILVVLSI
jgi:hypothetical protein